MTIATLGSLTVSAAVPAMNVSIAAGAGGINAVLPELVTELAQLALVVPTPVSFTAQIALLAAISAGVSAGMVAVPPLPVPNIALTLADTIAALTAKVASLNAQLAILTGFAAPLGVSGISGYAYDGAIGSLGSELGAAVGGGGTHANALALVTTDPAAWAAMGQILKVTP